MCNVYKYDDTLIKIHFLQFEKLEIMKKKGRKRNKRYYLQYAIFFLPAIINVATSDIGTIQLGIIKFVEYEL